MPISTRLSTCVNCSTDMLDVSSLPFLFFEGGIAAWTAPARARLAGEGTDAGPTDAAHRAVTKLD